MEQEKKKTLEETFNKLYLKLQKAKSDLDHIAKLVGFSGDTFDSLKEFETKYNASNAELSSIWSSISSAQRTKMEGTDFEKISKEIDTFFSEVTDLYKISQNEVNFSIESKSLYKINIQRFEDALKHHKTQSNWAKCVAVIGFGILISSFIGMLLASTKDTNEFQDITKDTEIFYAKLLISVIMPFLLKLSIFFIIAWFIRFSGHLHHKHERQVVIYQDRIAGLDIAELIVTQGNIDTRSEILKQMAETYLSSKENAFKETKSEKKEESATKKEVFTLLKTLIENVKK